MTLRAVTQQQLFGEFVQFRFVLPTQPLAREIIRIVGIAGARKRQRVHSRSGQQSVWDFLEFGDGVERIVELIETSRNGCFLSFLFIAGRQPKQVQWPSVAPNQHFSNVDDLVEQ